MTTELFIETYRLDVTADISALLNFALDDIKDFSSRSTAWSKTIILPGTSNNNQIFGHIFQIGQSNDYNSASPNVGYNFNASQSADCIIFQDNVQSFKGVIRLLQINIIKGRIEYEVSVFGKLAGLNVSLSGGLLENLDFSAYDHAYNDANIVASWDNPGGTGIYYPLIDYGNYSVNKHDWDIRTFRPAVYAYELIDKMFTAAGFRWSSDLFNTPKFRSLVVPYNKKSLTRNTSGLTGLASAQIDTTKIFVLPPVGTINIDFDSFSGTTFTANPSKTIFTYTGGLALNANVDFQFEGSFDNDDLIFNPSITIRLYKNGGTLLFSNTVTSSPFTIASNINISISPGDTLQWVASGTVDNLTLTFGSFTVTTTTGLSLDLEIGQTVVVNEMIPRNIRQIDFLVSIVKMFNLYAYEDALDTSLIHLKPYITFYQNAHNSALDWTYKINRNKAVKIKPMSELTAKIYKFKFKSDSDYYNDLYRKRYGEGYGDRIYDSEFEFTDQIKEFEVVFSATPLVGYGGEDKIYPTIFKRTGPETSAVEENIDSNIRILQSKKVTGVSSWQIKDGATVLNTLTRYGYAGHFDDPDAPNDDLNFGATRELFFVLTTGNLSNNQFNVYWSGYMKEITNKDSKLLSASFYLTPLDVMKLDFSKLIYLDGSLFRLNAIKDYNLSKPSDCVVELLKVNSVNYTEATDPESPPGGNFLLWSDDNTLDWDDLPDNELLYTGGLNSRVDWQMLVFAFGSTGNLKIFLNATLIVDTTTNPSIGSFTVTGGDVVEARISSVPSLRKKNLYVDSDIEGSLYADSGTTTNKTFNWVALSGRVYTINSSVTP